MNNLYKVFMRASWLHNNGLITNCLISYNTNFVIQMKELTQMIKQYTLTSRQIVFTKLFQSQPQHSDASCQMLCSLLTLTKINFILYSGVLSIQCICLITNALYDHRNITFFFFFFFCLRWLTWHPTTSLSFQTAVSVLLHLSLQHCWLSKPVVTRHLRSKYETKIIFWLNWYIY